MRLIIFTLTLLSLCAPAAADVQLRLKDGSGRVSTISSDGKLARIDGGEMEGYVIIDHGAGEMLMVDTQRREVLKTKLGKGVAAVAAGGGVAITLQNKGGGPKIAGYATNKFDFRANGEPCGTVYASAKLLRNPGVRAMFESMRALQRQSHGLMGGFGALMGICHQASLKLADAMQSSGAPMRIIDARGKLQSEVLGVDTAKKIPPAYYQLPAGIKVVSLEEKMGDITQQSQEMMQNLPDMNELMQQLQQDGGGVSEEMQQQMQDQMKKMQEMLQQLQKQQTQ